MRAGGLVFAAGAGLAIGLAALNSLFRPDRAGLFLFDHDEYQLRVLGFGASGGQQLLEPWMAALLILAGSALIVFAVRRARQLLLELIAQTA